MERERRRRESKRGRRMRIKTRRTLYSQLRRQKLWQAVLTMVSGRNNNHGSQPAITTIVRGDNKYGLRLRR